MYLKLPREPSTFFKPTPTGGIARQGQRAFKPLPQEDTQPSPCLQSGHLGAKPGLWGLVSNPLCEGRKLVPMEGGFWDPRTIMLSASGTWAHPRENCPSQIKTGEDDLGRCRVCSSVYEHGFP